MQLNDVPGRRRHWLAVTPRLLAAYRAAGNRWRRRERRDGFIVLAFLALWTGFVVRLSGCSLRVLNSFCRWSAAHGLALAAATLAAALLLVSRRRAVVRADSARSWLAALAVARIPAFLEARTLELAPALLLLASLAIACASLLAVATFRSVVDLRGLAKAEVTVLVAVFIGALVSYVIPPGRDEALPPGSRYVPHRRRAGPPLPRASLAGLGEWPVRRLFATLRPTVVARAALPVLLVVPVGATADAALLVLGVAAASAALLLLIVSIHHVSRASCRWLQPLPLIPAALCRALLARALVALSLLACVWGDLVWVAGMAPRDALQRSVVLWLLCTTLAAGASWFATHCRMDA
jgi:hypothetical protein